MFHLIIEYRLYNFKKFYNFLMAIEINIFVTFQWNHC